LPVTRRSSEIVSASTHPQGRAFAIRDNQINMEPQQSMSKFDRWRENCFAILDNGVVIACPDQSEWVKWMRKSLSNGEHWIVEDNIVGFYISTEFLGSITT
jgi:hypothetical protein